MRLCSKIHFKDASKADQDDAEPVILDPDEIRKLKPESDIWVNISNSHFPLRVM